MLGPGKYDEVDTVALKMTEAKGGVILLVFDGKEGNGFSCQLTYDLTLAVPAILREIAEAIESDFKKGNL